jgi:hypothetical protein
MSKLEEIEERAMGLTARERGQLAERLIASLPGPFIEQGDDDWVEEALRRSREMDENPEMVLTEAEFFASFEAYRRK